MLSVFRAAMLTTQRADSCLQFDSPIRTTTPGYLLRVSQADGPNQVMEAAGSSMNMHRLNFQSTLGGEVLTVDQVKGRPKNGKLDDVYSVRVKPEEGVNESTCAPDYDGFRIPHRLVYVDDAATTATKEYFKVINKYYDP
jgi:hypothetical protein